LSLQGTTPMPNKHLPMRLSPEEERFLCHWMSDEAHYQEGTGAAKRLQVEHQAVPAELAVIIAAAMPDLAEQWAAANGPPRPDRRHGPGPRKRSWPALPKRARPWLAGNAMAVTRCGRPETTLSAP